MLSTGDIAHQKINQLRYPSAVSNSVACPAAFSACVGAVAALVPVLLCDGLDAGTGWPGMEAGWAPAAVSKLVYLGDFDFQELAVRPSDTSKFLESFQ